MALEIRYTTSLGQLLHGDGLAWLRQAPEASVDLVVADPPYGIRKAEWDTFESIQSYVAWSREWVEECARILRPHGSLYICGFSEILAEVQAAVRPLFAGCKWLVWYYRNKANMGQDWGRSHESILHLRCAREHRFNQDAVRIPYNAHTTRYPQRRQAATSTFSAGGKRRDSWSPDPRGAKPRDVFEIPTLCNGMPEKTPHPTQKPLELMLKLVLASSDPGDLVVDPFAGAGTTLVVAEVAGRRWVGIEQSDEYCALARQRLESIDFDVEELRELEHRRTGNRRSLR
jgi:site-specific DNA-methyltransferase (adenine-specific)